MRIWHSKLIPGLCRQHLLAVWREGLGMYSIITNNKKGYVNHPATREFKNSICDLWCRLYEIRCEMLARGYKPKELPEFKRHVSCLSAMPWESLEVQREKLKAKGCGCKI